MRKVNADQIEEFAWSSPKGKFAGFGRQISEALGRDPLSTDLMKRHPFDVEIMRIPPGKIAYPYHSHSAQWEFYYVLSGNGISRDAQGRHQINAGDAFIYPPGAAHQLINESNDDLRLFVVADNPIGESCHYPDSNKWIVRSPERRLIRSEPLDYFDGEE
ncbi:MAG: cupin domain-containing protein [Verrucomicrobia bacterium]|nr:cupin domain-containing protein [Verrucomicrobiota bacterium]